MEAPLSEPFSLGKRKWLADLMASCCGKLGVDIFSTSEMFYPIKKIRLRMIRARPNFYIISENSNVSLGIVDCSL